MRRSEKMQLARALAAATHPEVIRPSREGRGTSAERSQAPAGDRGTAPPEERPASPVPRPRTCEPCQVLSTEMHRYCQRDGCQCPCRLRNRFPRDRPKRPHSYPRPDWKRRLPAGTTRRLEERRA